MSFNSKNNYYSHGGNIEAESRNLNLRTDQIFDAYNPDQSTSFAPYRIFNIGNSQSIELLRFIELLEDALGVKSIKNFKPIQPGDVEVTAADTNLIEAWIGFKPSTSIEKGVNKFAKWYLDYYRN